MKRIYNKPKNGGLGTIHLNVCAASLRMAWVKRANGGLWSNTLTAKVAKPENICYLKTANIHGMHKGIKHIIASFEEVHDAFKSKKDDNVIMHTPIYHFSIMRVNNPRIRNNGIKLGKPTKENAPFLFNNKDKC